jgi:hypothetical protein
MVLARSIRPVACDFRIFHCEVFGGVADHVPDFMRDGESARRNAAQKNDAPSAAKTSFLIRWSIQEIRRIVIKLAQRRIQPAHIIAWSLGEELTKPKHAAPISKRKCNCNAS